MTLQRSRQAAFENYLSAVQDPSSSHYHHFLPPAQLTRAFGPSQQAYDAVRSWLSSEGFSGIQGSADRLTISAHGTRSLAERAFDTPIDDYSVQGRSVFANTENPAVPAAIGRDVLSVSGLSDVGQPARTPQTSSTVPIASDNLTWSQAAAYAAACGVGAARFGLVFAILAFAAPIAWLVLALAMLWGCSLGVLGYFFNTSYGPGSGGPLAHGATPHVTNQQKIGLLEYDTFRKSDVTDWLQGIGGTAPTSADRLSEVNVNGGDATPGPGESEVLLDIDSTLFLTQSAGTDVVAYDAPSSTSFEQMFNAMIDDGDTVISNSWSQCEDETSLSEAKAIDSVLQQAAADGISVFNGSGDTGSTCLDGSPDTVGVPSDSPNATSVGGSSLTLGAGGTYQGESWWGSAPTTPPTGQGGFGVSKDFSRPSYQDGLTGASGRSVPDVVAPADPTGGVQLCEADSGGCPNGLVYGGTSVATPEWAALIANLNTDLGHDVGNVNTALYPLAGTASFHTAADLNSDFAHVGLGDANFAQLLLALSHTSPGAPIASNSVVAAIGDTSTLDTDGHMVAADGATTGTVRVDLKDTNKFPVAGKTVTLAANLGCHATISAASGLSDNVSGSVTFTVTDATVESCTFTATDSTDNVTLTTQPTLAFFGPIATGASITASPNSVPDDGTSQATVSVYLQNSLNQPAAGKTVTLKQVVGSATVVPGSTAVTNAAGFATFTATDTTAETVTFTATDTTDGNLPVPGSANVQFVNGTQVTCNSGTPTTSGGYGLTTFSQPYPYTTQTVALPGNFNLGACTGVGAPAFDPNGNVYIPSYVDGTIHVLPSGGGAATAANQLPAANFGPYNLDGLAFGPDGSLYATLQLPNGVTDNQHPEIVQLNPDTGAVLRVIATVGQGLTLCPGAPEIDPFSGNLFVANSCTGFLFTGQVSEISDPSGASPTVSTFTTVSADMEQLAFAPDGSLYVMELLAPATVVQIAGPDTAPMTTTPVAQVSSNFGIGLAVTGSNAQGAATSLAADDITGTSTPGSSVYSIDLTTHPATVSTIVSPPTSGETTFANQSVGSDSCLYVAQAFAVDRLGVGACGTGGNVSHAPSLSLTTDAPAQPLTGSSVDITATLQNVSGATGTPVSFAIKGANTQPGLVHVGSGQTATFTYSAVHPGTDTVVATATVNSQTLTSNPINITWAHGKDKAFLTMNSSQLSGTMGTAATVRANLADVSPQSPTPISGAPITLSLGAAHCQATTDAQGNAACSLTPSTSGLLTQSSAFAGDSSLTPAQATNVFTAAVGASPPPPVTTVNGYWLSSADGGVFSFGGATFYGSMGGKLLNKPVVGMAASRDGLGYWLVAADGGIFAFGDAQFFGSTGGMRLNAPVVGMAPTPDGNGYWLLSADGGIFAFGDAHFYGSTGGMTLNAPVVAMAATPDGKGYWLAAKDGGVFGYGDALFYGSSGGQLLNAPVVGISTTPDRRGYWLDASDGGIFGYGDARFYGSMGGKLLNKPVVGMAATPDGGGYWLDASDGGIFAFGDAAFYGSTGGLALNAPMVAMAASPTSGSSAMERRTSHK